MHITQIANTLTETSNTITVDNTIQTVDSSTIAIEDRTLLETAADNNDDLSFDSTYSYTDIYTNSIPTTSNTELDGDTEKLVLNNTHNQIPEKHLAAHAPRLLLIAI